MTLKEIAVKIVGDAEADKYLKFELPEEDPSREFELVASDNEVEIYRDSDVYLLHCSTGLETGMWDDLATDYPAVATLLNKQLVSDSKMIKSAGGVEIYEHPTKGRFAVLEEGQVSWDEDAIRATLDEQ